MAGKVEERIRAGGAVLAFDTNAVSGTRRLFDLCDVANRLEMAPRPLILRRCVPALAHAEMVFHIRHALLSRNKPYSPEKVRAGLLDKGLAVETFGMEDAEAAAEFLSGRFSTPEAWRAAKRQRYVDALALPRDQADAARGKTCPATVDWYIAAHAASRGWILVTSDTGREFQDVELRIALGALEALLRTLLAERSGSAPAP